MDPWSKLMNMELFDMPDMVFIPEQPSQTPKQLPKKTSHRKYVWNHVSCTVFYAEFEFHIGLSQNSLPGVEKSTFHQIRRKNLKILETCTVFYGEFESEAGFTIKLKKSTKKLGKKKEILTTYEILTASWGYWPLPQNTLLLRCEGWTPTLDVLPGVPPESEKEPNDRSACYVAFVRWW